MEECHCYLLTTKEILCAATLVCFNRDSDLVLSITMRLLQLWFILTWLLPWVPDCCCSHFCFWFIVAWKPNFRRIKHAELLSNSSLWIVICARISCNNPRFLGLMYDVSSIKTSCKFSETDEGKWRCLLLKNDFDFSVGNFTNSTSRKNSFTSSSSNDVVWGFIFSYYVVWLNLCWWKSIFENLLSPRKTFSYGHFLFRRVLSVVWILQPPTYAALLLYIWGYNPLYYKSCVSLSRYAR